MNDALSSYSASPTTPARRAGAIAPSDTVPLADIPKALFVGTGGTLVMGGIDGEEPSIWRNIPSGSYVLFRPRLVLATGTTASDILGLY